MVHVRDEGASATGRVGPEENLPRLRVFQHSAEEYDVLLPFAKEGYERGEKLFQIVDREHRSERLRRLAEAGIPENGDGVHGQVEVALGKMPTCKIVSLTRMPCSRSSRKLFTMARRLGTA